MAKKRKKSKQQKRTSREENLVKVDIFYVPEEQAELYRTLREAVAEDTIAWAEEQSQFDHVKRVPDEDEGESIVGYDADETVLWRYYLNPTNISQAQKARDKDQIAVYLENYQSLE